MTGIDEVNPSNGPGTGSGTTKSYIEVGSTAMPSSWSQPASLPEPVDNSPEAPEIYRGAIYGSLIIIGLIVVGSFAATLFDKAMPEGVISIATLLAGGIVALISYRKGIESAG